MDIASHFTGYGQKPGMLFFEYHYSDVNVDSDLCGLDIAKRDGKYHILISDVAACHYGTHNFIEKLAEEIALLLRLNHIEEDSENLVFYELRLPERDPDNTGFQINRVDFLWHDNRPFEPVWVPLTFEEAPFDLSDFVSARTLLRDD